MSEQQQVINPEWRAAIDEAMKKSIMTKQALANDIDAAPQIRSPTPRPPDAPQAARLPPAPIFHFDEEDEEEEEEEMPPTPPPRKHKRHREERPSPRSFFPPPPQDDDDDDEEEFEEEEFEEDEEEDDDDDDGAHERIAESREIQEEEKMDLLVRLQSFIDSGEYKPVRAYTMADKFEAIRFEVFRAEREVNRKRSIRMMQKGLVSTAMGMEVLNRYMGSPLGLNLDGYSRSVLISINDYTDILEELHFLYKDSIRLRPEVRLLMMMGSSAYMYSMTRGARQSYQDRESGESTTRMRGPSNKPETPASATSAPTTASSVPDMAGLAMLSTLLK